MLVVQRPVISGPVSKIIGKAGEDAKVLVDEESEKYASAHDFRRSFGTRWAKRVMRVTLKRLMRHANISTTMKYYVEHDVEKIADELWQQFPTAKSNTFGNTSQKDAIIQADNK
ncbi:MAG: site-specific integrase [Planctomycetales bacterium]|nr:site-specific integrase [Planctomycetales bacterium]